MALWQYTFQILPKESVEMFSHHHLKNGVSEFDDELYWKLVQVNKSLFYPVQEVMQKNKSWSNDIDLYGTQDTNCLEVIFNNREEVTSASFRIDFRDNYEKPLNKMVEFCILNGLVILNEDANVAPLNFEQLQKIIAESPQAKRYSELSSRDRLP